MPKTMRNSSNCHTRDRNLYIFSIMKTKHVLRQHVPNSLLMTRKTESHHVRQYNIRSVLALSGSYPAANMDCPVSEDLHIVNFAILHFPGR
jgi:hypothetical protein